MIRHEFGPEGAAYVKAYLDADGRLGQLLARRDIDAGTTWALVPRESSPQQRVDFEQSLFPDAGPPIPVERGFLVPKFHPASDPQTTAAIVGLLRESSSTRRLICAEAAFARRTDPPFAGGPTAPKFFCGDAVYRYVTSDMPIEQIMGQLVGATWQPNVGMISTLPDGLDLRDGEVSPEALEAMAADAIAVIVGAWDAESLLFWQPRR